MQPTTSTATDRVAGYIASCGSLDAALDQLRHDACEARSGDLVHEIYRAALAERSAQRQATQEAADPALKARRMRAKAQDLRAAYGRHMEAYGEDIGRATRRAAQNETTLAALAESAAQASLILGSECLTEALALEAEVDRIEAAPFVVLFDGVSARAADVIACLHAAQ